MKEKILLIMSLAIDLQKKSVHVNCSYNAKSELFDVRIFVLGWTPHSEPTIKRMVWLKDENAILELNVIEEYLSQLLQKVSAK